MGRSGLADELNFVATNRHTLQSKQHPNIFVLGDATDLLSSKFSSLAYFQSEVLTENILHQIKGEPLESQLDGHARRIDFNYKLQTVDGKYRLPGPRAVLKRSGFELFQQARLKVDLWILLVRSVAMQGIRDHMSHSERQNTSTSMLFCRVNNCARRSASLKRPVNSESVRE